MSGISRDLHNSKFLNMGVKCIKVNKANLKVHHNKTTRKSGRFGVLRKWLVKKAV